VIARCGAPGAGDDTYVNPIDERDLGISGRSPKNMTFRWVAQ
jgi:hypothetical protein